MKMDGEFVAQRNKIFVQILRIFCNQNQQFCEFLTTFENKNGLNGQNCDFYS